MKTLIQAALFQAAWFVCVFAGNGWALLATGSYLLIHHNYYVRRLREWYLIAIFLILGCLVDGSLFALNIMSTDEPMLFVLPIWLLCLWVMTATLFAHSLSFLQGKYWLSALLGLCGPTLSYFGGAKIAGVIMAEPVFISLSIIAIIWAVVLPFGVWFSQKLELFENKEWG